MEEHVPIKTPKDIDNELIAAFEKFDTNKNFLINKDEFRHILTSDTMGDEPLTEEEADELLANLDVDGDEQLNITGNFTWYYYYQLAELASHPSLSLTSLPLSERHILT